MKNIIISDREGNMKNIMNWLSVSCYKQRGYRC